MLAAAPGIAINDGSLRVASETEPAFTSTGMASNASIGFYDGSIADLGIGAGLLLTSGDAHPSAINENSGYGAALPPSETDAELNTSIRTAFPAAADVEDTTSLKFDFIVSDPELTGIEFDPASGSDDYPESGDNGFVDIERSTSMAQYAPFNDRVSQLLRVLWTIFQRAISAITRAGRYRSDMMDCPIC